MVEVVIVKMISITWLGQIPNQERCFSITSFESYDYMIFVDKDFQKKDILHFLLFTEVRHEKTVFLPKF